jgi:hypothetical protein
MVYNDFINRKNEEVIKTNNIFHKPLSNGFI